MVVPNSSRRFSVYSAHFDPYPAFFVDPAGRAVVQHHTTLAVELRPTSTLQVYGSFATRITQFTDSATLDDSHNSVIANKATAITITVPLASGASGRMYYIKNVNDGVCTVARSGSDTFGAADTTIILYNRQSVLIQSDGGSAWRIISINRSRASLGIKTTDFASTGTGTTSLVLDTTTARLYVRHQTSSTASQTYTYYVELVLPENFLSFPANALTVNVRTSRRTAGSHTATIYKSDNTTDSTISAASIQAAAENTWETKTLTPGSTYSPGERVLIAFASQLSGLNNATQDLDNIILTYNTL
jgi:hypothetical protein